MRVETEWSELLSVQLSDMGEGRPLETNISDPGRLVRDDWNVHERAYLDPAVFEIEMDRIFTKSWVYVAHDSEIPNPGDYKTTFIGRQPVIVTRGADDGVVRVLFNRCRHRGATVCQLEYGNANYFRCAYHGWTYGNDGSLTGVSFSQGYGKDFDKSSLGLVPVGAVESYKGFVFARVSAEGKSLSEHLGKAKPYLDEIAGRDIDLSAGYQRNLINANWKQQLENTTDPYHFTFVHKSYQKVLERRTGRKDEYSKNQLRNPTWQGLDLGDGHGVHQYGEGHDLATGDLSFNITIFPNLAFVGHHLRTIRPLEPMKAEVRLYPILLKGADDEVNASRLREHEAFYGPAGFGQPDDLEVAFERVKRGFSAKGNEWIVISRGAGNETDKDGVLSGGSTEEVPIRAIWRQWKKLMSE